MLILGENCLKIGSGATPRGGKEVYSPDGPISLIRSQNIYNEGFNFNGLARISTEQAKNLENVKIFTNDILLNITGDSVARACLVDQDALPARVNQHVAIIRTNPKKINPLFLRYYLITPTIQNHLLALSSAGATRNALTKAMIESLLIPNYNLYKQRAIASILGSLDDKIDLNRRTNETLEAMARALFRDWFVDFGPTRAKMAGEAPYLAPELWELFPDKLDDEGRPEGWNNSQIGKQFNITMGQSPPGDTYNSDGYGKPFYQGKTDFGTIFPTRRMYCTAPKRLAYILDSLVSVRAPVGEVNLSIEECCIGRGLAAIHHPRNLPFYTYLVMKSLRETFSSFENNGTVFGSINKKQFEELDILESNIENIFEEKVSLIYQKIIANENESLILSQLRDLLLPKLMSGEISIRDAEKMVEDAA